MSCKIDYIEDRFRKSNPTLADSLTGTFDAIKVKVLESKLFKPANDGTGRYLFAQESKNITAYNAQKAFVDDVNDSYKGEVIENYNGAVRINVLNLPEAQQALDTYATPIKEGVPELFESNPELAAIGTQQQYSQYLDTIFPDSKVKDIVYHGTNEKFDKFSKLKKGTKTINKTNQLGFYFGDRGVAEIFNSLLPKDYIGNKGDEKLDNLYKLYIDRYGEQKANEILTELMNRMGYDNPRMFERLFLPDSVTLPVILNIKNPAPVSTEEFAASTKGTGEAGYELYKNLEQTYDGIILNKIEDAGFGGEEFEKGRNFVVFESEQIHILGGKQDIEGFKQYIENVSSIAVMIAGKDAFEIDAMLDEDTRAKLAYLRGTNTLTIEC